MKRFTRLALGFSKKRENLAAAIALFIAYFNFCWVPKTLNGTPAMPARIAGHPWTLQELLAALEPFQRRQGPVARARTLFLRPCPSHRRLGRLVGVPTGRRTP